MAPPLPFNVGRQRISQQLIASISRLLDSHKIPAVLCGDSMLSNHGAPVVVEDISFVIPDEAIPRAANVLQHAEFRPCSLPQKCWHTPGNLDRASPTAAMHFHWCSPDALLLFKKSDFFPRLTNLSVDPDSALNPRFVLASNRKYLPEPEPVSGFCAFLPQFYPVRVPSAPCILEAQAFQFLRQDKDPRYFSYWVTQMSYVASYIEQKGRLDLNKVEDRSRNLYQDIFHQKTGLKMAVANYRKAYEDSRSGSTGQL